MDKVNRNPGGNGNCERRGKEMRVSNTWISFGRERESGLKRKTA